jgi:hypothetical protein
VSEAGRLITTRQLFASFRRLRERLREGELGLEAPARQVSLVVELASVGDPLVDEDEAGPVRVEELAERIARARRPLVVRADTLERLPRLAGPARRVAELPGELAPERPDERAVLLADGVPGRDAIPDEDDAARDGQLLRPRLLKDGVDPRELTGVASREQVVEREHRVRLPAAEVRLELNDRVAALARDPQDGAREEALQAVREVSTPEELDGIAVLVRPLAEVNLPQVGGKLGLLVPSARDVLVRRHDLAPRLQGPGGGALDRRARALSLLAPDLLVEADAQELHLHLLELGALGRRHAREEAARRVEGSVGIVARERLLVSPAVSLVAELAHEGPLRWAERLPEDVVPRVPHDPEQDGDVPLRDRLLRVHAIVAEERHRLRRRLRLEDAR